jgi:hypothetical protein
LVEQPIRNRQVTSSTLVVGSIPFKTLKISSPGLLRNCWANYSATA